MVEIARLQNSPVSWGELDLSALEDVGHVHLKLIDLPYLSYQWGENAEIRGRVINNDEVQNGTGRRRKLGLGLGNDSPVNWWEKLSTCMLRSGASQCCSNTGTLCALLKESG